jgi:anthranilate synthase component 2
MMKKVLVIDNYDSFTYNLVHYLEDLDCKVTVLRNDELELSDIVPFDKIILSPGPGIPEEAGLLKAIIATYASSKSILGVCLGHQAIAEVFGATLLNLNTVYHGVATPITIVASEELLFKNLPDIFPVGRYHSWSISKNNFPETLEITAIDNYGEIMAIRHKTFNVRGVQFHPESILTPVGKTILYNWINQ